MSKNKKIELTPRKIKEIKNKASRDTLVLVAACLMDEYDMNAEQIANFSKRFERYYHAVENKVITIKTVEEIVYENIGLEFDFN